MAQNFLSDIKLGDSIYIRLGDRSGGDLNLYHNGTNTFIDNHTGQLYIRNFSDDKNIHFQSDDGSGGMTDYIVVHGSENIVKFQEHTRHLDNKQARFGTGSDLKILHDGTNSTISNHTGDLQIINHADDKDIIFYNDDGNGGIEEYFRLDGSANGVHPQTSFPDNSNLTFGGGPDTYLYHNGTNFFLSEYTGDMYIENHGADKDIIFRSDDGSGGITEYFRVDGDATNVLFSRKAKFSDNVEAVFGDGADLKIYHDGNTSFIKDAGTGNLEMWADGAVIIKSGDGTETKALFDTNGSVDLYYDNSKKLETTNVGITVSGTTASSSVLINGGADAQAKILGTTTAARLDIQTDSHHRFLQTIESDGRFRLYNQTTSAEQLTVLSNGNVGISEASPDTQLHISSADDVYITLESTDASTPEEVAIKYNNQSTGSNYWWSGLNQQADWSLAYGSSFSASNTQFTVNTTGYVAIGGHSPTLALDVKGTTNLASRFMFTKDLSTDKVLFGGADHDTFGAPFIGSSSNHSFTITQNGAKAITIDTSKNATFEGAINTSGELTVNNAANNNNLGIHIKNDNNLYSGALTFWTEYSGTDTHAARVQAGTDGTDAALYLQVANTSKTLTSVLTLDHDLQSTFAGDLMMLSGTNGTTSKIIFKRTDNTSEATFIRTNAYWNEYGAHRNEGHKFIDSNSNILLQLNGDNSTTGNGALSATFAGDVLLSSSKGLYTNVVQAVSSAGLKLGNDDNSEYVFIKDDTGVGIGTTTPSGSGWDGAARILHIYKNSTNGALLALESSNTKGILAAGNNRLSLFTTTEDQIRIGTNGTIALSIDTAQIPTFQNATASGTAMYIHNTTDSVANTKTLIDFRAQASDNSTFYVSGQMGSKAEGTWTSTSSTRDASLIFNTVLNGNNELALTLASDKSATFEGQVTVDSNWVSDEGSLSIVHDQNTLGGIGIVANGVYKGGLIQRDGTAGNFMELTAYQAQSLKLRTSNTDAVTIDTSQNTTFAGDVMPAAENAHNIGSASVRWEDLYVDDGYIRNAYIDEYIYHNGNTTTYARFQTNRLTLHSGGGAVVDLHSNGQLYFTGVSTFYNNATFVGNVSVNGAGQKAVLHVKNEGNNWEDGVLLEHDSGDTGWNIHPENNSDNALWFGYNSDTSVALTSQAATVALKLNSDLNAIFTGGVTAGGNIVINSASTSATLGINATTHNTNAQSVAWLSLGYEHSGGSAYGEVKLTESTNNSFDGDMTFRLPYNNGSGGSSTRTVFTLDGSDKSGKLEGPLFLNGSAARVSGTSGGEIGLNYNTGSNQALVWYAGGTTPKFSVTNNGDGTFEGDVLINGGDLTVKDTGTENAYIRAYATGTGAAGLYIDAVNGDAAGSDYFSLRQLDNKAIEFNARTGTGNTLFYSKGSLNLTQNGADSTFAGNVGIGTDPGGKLHIKHSSTQLILETPNTTNDIDFRWRENGTNKWNMRYQNSGNHLQFLNQTGTSLTQLSLNADGSSTFKGDVEIHNEGNDTTGKLTISGNNNTGTPGQKTSGTIEHRGAHLKTVITHNGSDVITIGTGTQVQFAGNVTVSGDFEVNGITTTTNVVNLDVSDNIIGLNRGSTSNSNDSGLIIERGSTGDNAAFLWDESDDRFIFGTTTANPAATGNITYTAAPFGGKGLWTTSSAVTHWGVGPQSTAYGTLTWDTGYAKVHATGSRELHLGSGGDSDAVKINGSDVTIAGQVETKHNAGIYSFSHTVGTSSNEDIFELDNTHGAQAFRATFVCSTSSYSVAKTFEVVHQHGVTPVYTKVVDTGAFGGHDFSVAFASVSGANNKVRCTITNASSSVNANIVTTVFLGGSPTDITVTEL